MSDQRNDDLSERSPLGPPTFAQYLDKLELEHDLWLCGLPDEAWQLEDRGYQDLTPAYEMEQLCYFPWFGTTDDARVRFILTGSR